MTANRCGRERRGPAPFPFLGGVLLLASLLLAHVPAHAQEKTVTLTFTKELLYNIARDNQGEMNKELVSRMKGLSPGIDEAAIVRAGGDITLAYTVKVGGGLRVRFNLTIEKMAFYRMATAREDVDGMLAILKPAKEKEPLIRSLAYRFKDNYSIIDVGLDVGPAIEKREKEEMRKAALALAGSGEPKTADLSPPSEEVKAPDRKAAPKKAEPEKTPPKKIEKKKVDPKEAEAKKAEAKKAKRKKGASYLTVRSLKKWWPPVLDGDPSDGAWQDARPYYIVVRGASGNFEMKVVARYEEDRLYLLLQWPDSREDVEHRPWTWSEEGQEYIVGKAVEDALALQFSTEGRLGDCMLSGKEAVADLWSWRAARTNPVGFAEDGSLTAKTERIPKANFYQAKNGKTVWVKERRDEGTPPYKSQVAGSYEGEKVRRYVPRTPSGSVADVTAGGKWEKGVWTVEFSRALKTGDAADVVFALKKDIYFSVAVFDGRERSEHSVSVEHVMRLD